MTRFFLRALVRLSNVYRRVLALFFAIIGPKAAYSIIALLARLLYRSLDPLRLRSETQCRAALNLAEQSFVHRAWNLADLMLADRLLHLNTYHRFGGRIPEPRLSGLLRAQQNGHPVILVTAYYGPFDLLPLFLGYNGLRASVVYRPHDNAGFDAYRRRIRGRSGCELIPVDRASNRCAQILAAGGTIAIVADHPADHGGLPVTFLGLPTTAMRSVGLLAWRYSANVAVAGIRRVGSEFRFEIVVSDVIQCHDWEPLDDPVAYITARYLRGLEQLILGDPTQYLWVHARWGEDCIRRLIAEHQSGTN